MVHRHMCTKEHASPHAVRGSLRLLCVGHKVTYLDEEVMIVRDESGVPDVLVKKLSAAPAMEAEEIPEVSTNSTNSKSSLMSPFWARERSNVSNVSTAASDEDRALLDAAGSEAS